ncbi:HNH endonuclease [Schinkia azotoformans]|uniref:HNH endonuclease n=1 Tax=Schinkia azotoformans TaxID=1454 RepID=UPI002DBD14E1|nr:hypothetical protein [Schinkia azotoformans]MEC1757389.1 hypothetical protein [Schinkia azotoformans]
MLKSCQYCGSIHDSKYNCPSKPKRKRIVKDNDNTTMIRQFRDSVAWKRKRQEIQERDLRLCQVCIRKLYNTLDQFTYENTSVHHCIPLVEDWSKRLDNDKLITLCSYHHTMADNGLIPVDVLLEIVREQEDKWK